MNTSIDQICQNGQVEIEGLTFEVLEGGIQVGDHYIAQRNTGLKLLQAESIESNFIIPTSMDYCYNTWECVKVKLKD